MTTTRNPIRRRLAARKAATAVSVLFGAVLGAIVIGGFIAFWLNGNDFHRAATDTTRQETSGLNALNRIAQDVSESSAIALADSRQIVLTQPQGDGTTNYVRYALTTDGKLYKQTRVNAPAGFNPQTGFPAAPTRGFIVTSVSAAANGKAFFTYTTKAGAPLPVPAYNPGTASQIALVDVTFAAQTKAISGTGTLELHTSAAINSGSGAQVDAIPPACPVVRFIQADPYPIMVWNMTGQTTEFRITRTGTGGIGLATASFTLAASTDEEIYEFADPSIEGAVAPINYQILAYGAGGLSTDCGITRWYPRLATPDVDAYLYPATPEPTDWPGNVPSEARLTWPSVTGAHSYEVYRRTLAASNKFTGDYNAINGFTLVSTISDNSPYTGGENVSYNQQIGRDTAYAYRVVAFGPMPESSPRDSGVKVLSHTRDLGNATATVQDRNENYVTWSGDPGPTATELALWRRDLSGCYPARSGWSLVVRLDLDEEEYVDTDAVAGTRYEYAVAAYNFGPRGTVSAGAPIRYASRFGGTGSALQYPAIPSISASGSSGGPAPTPWTSAGVNRVFMYAGCASTTDNFDLSIYPDRFSAAESVIPGLTGSYNDTGRPRATSRWYKAVANNETGSSANADTGIADAVAAYQYPTKPPTPGHGGTNYTQYNEVTYVPVGGTPPASMGSCRFMAGIWSWGPATWSTGHAGGGFYRSPSYASMESTALDANTAAHWHYSPYRSSDQWYCDRYNADVTFTWSGNAADNGTPGGDFCATYGANCSYEIRFSYRNPAGAIVPATCTVASTSWNPKPTSCTYTFYSGSQTQPAYTVQTGTKLVATNPGGSAISDEPVVVIDPGSPDPLGAVAFQVVGSRTNPDGTGRTNVGRNTIYWGTVRGATGYRVYAYPTYSGNVNTDTGPRLVYQGGAISDAGGLGAMSNSVYDTARPRGSETYYRVFAYNAAGQSPPGAKKAAYQMPFEVNLTQSGVWDPADEQITWTWNRAADEGMAANAKFCTPGRGACTQTLLFWDKTLNEFVKRRNVPTGNQEVTVNLAAGADTSFAMLICNTGGCDQSPLVECSPVCSLAPGPFDLVNDGNTMENRGNKWSGAGLMANNRIDATLAPKWSASDGAVDYRVGRTVGGGDPHNRVRPVDYNGTGALMTTFATAGPSDPDNPRQARPWQSTPGALYVYDVYAVGSNGKVRKETFRIMAQPSKVVFGQAAIFCKRSAASDLHWKIGYEFDARGRSFDAATRMDKVKSLVWAGRMTTAEWALPEATRAAAAMRKGRELAGIAGNSDSDDTGYNDGRFPGGTDRLGNWDTYANWRADDWGTASAPGFSSPGGIGLWESDLPGTRGTAAGGRNRFVFGGGDDNKVLPTLDRTIAAVQSFSWLDPSSYTVDGGRFVTSNNTYAMPRDGAAPSADGACSAGPAWHANNWTGAVGRWASVYTGWDASGKYGNPPSDPGTANSYDNVGY